MNFVIRKLVFFLCCLLLVSSFAFAAGKEEKKDDRIPREPIFSSTNFYDLIGGDSSWTLDENKAAFRANAKRFHPDKNQNSEESAKKFTAIKLAWDSISSAKSGSGSSQTASAAEIEDYWFKTIKDIYSNELSSLSPQERFWESLAKLRKFLDPKEMMARKIMAIFDDSIPLFDLSPETHRAVEKKFFNSFPDSFYIENNFDQMRLLRWTDYLGDSLGFRVIQRACSELTSMEEFSSRISMLLLNTRMESGRIDTLVDGWYMQRAGSFRLPSRSGRSADWTREKFYSHLAVQWIKNFGHGWSCVDWEATHLSGGSHALNVFIGHILRQDSDYVLEALVAIQKQAVESSNDKPSIKVLPSEESLRSRSFMADRLGVETAPTRLEIAVLKQENVFSDLVNLSENKILEYLQAFPEKEQDLVRLVGVAETYRILNRNKSFTTRLTLKIARFCKGILGGDK